MTKKAQKALMGSAVGKMVSKSKKKAILSANEISKINMLGSGIMQQADWANVQIYSTGGGLISLQNNLHSAQQQAAMEAQLEASLEGLRIAGAKAAVMQGVAKAVNAYREMPGALPHSKRNQATSGHDEIVETAEVAHTDAEWEETYCKLLFAIMGQETEFFLDTLKAAFPKISTPNLAGEIGLAMQEPSVVGYLLSSGTLPFHHMSEPAPQSMLEAFYEKALEILTKKDTTMEQEQTTTETATIKSVTQTPEDISKAIDAEVAAETIHTSPEDDAAFNAINLLLTQTTKGAVTDVKGVLNENRTLKNKVTKYKRELTRALVDASKPKYDITGVVSAIGEELTYEVVIKKANDVFDEVDGKKKHHGALAFDIPTLVWKNKSGEVVRHPGVPFVDDNYEFSSGNLIKFLTATNHRMNQWLFGHTGTGKSTFVEQIAARTGWPVTRINLDSSLERADLVGHIVLSQDNGATISTFEEGILPKAMTQPGYLLMDEIDAGRPDILFVVQRALEHKGLMLTEDKGRVVQPHDLFRFVATANTRGQGDECGMYAGTRAMNASMIDRFTSFIEFGYLPAGRETALLRKIVPAIPGDMAEKMVQFASEVRTAFGKGEVYNTVSPRGLSVLSQCYVTFTSYGGDAENKALKMAMEMSILNKVTNDTRQKFIELGSRVFAEKFN